jgi:predicted porin
MPQCNSYEAPKLLDPHIVRRLPMISKNTKTPIRTALLTALLPLAVAVPHAVAQTANVQLYGVVDVGVNHVKGVKGGSVTAVASGILEGSRVGIRGTEDMGGGLKATFVMEMRIEADTGAGSNRAISGTQLPDRLTAGLPPAVQAALTNVAIGPTLGVNVSNKLFDRQIYAGLITPVGAVLAGRQYTPGFEIVSRFDAFQVASGASAAQLITIPAGVDIRTDNALLYRIEKDGLFGSAMYSFGENAAGFKNGSMYGVNAGYSGGRFGAGIGYNARKNSAGQKALSTFVVGGNFNAGFVNLYAMGAQIKEPNPGSGPELLAGLSAAGVPSILITSSILPRLMQDARLYHVGAKLPLGVSSVTLGYSQLDDRRATNADVKSFGALFTYPLSKRTDVNFAVTQFNNSANAQSLPGGNGFLGGVTAFGGKDATAFQFSLRHKF